jgi:hypothetical protein
MVRAVSPGLAVITATSEGKTGSVTVTILPVPVASVTITPSPAEVRVGLTTQLSVVARDAAGNALGGRPVTLATSNAAVATVDANRVVTGVSAGTATITATSEGKTATVTVTATPGPVTAVEVAPGAQSVSVGSTVQLSASARDASGAAVTGRAVAWSTSNPVIATVSAAGVVTGMAAGGPVSITATVEGRSASAQITVTPAPVATLTISPNPAEVRVGLTTQLAVVARDAAGQRAGRAPGDHHHLQRVHRHGGRQPRRDRDVRGDGHHHRHLRGDNGHRHGHRHARPGDVGGGDPHDRVGVRRLHGPALRRGA